MANRIEFGGATLDLELGLQKTQFIEKLIELFNSTIWKSLWQTMSIEIIEEVSRLEKVENVEKVEKNKLKVYLNFLYYLQELWFDSDEDGKRIENLLKEIIHTTISKYRWVVSKKVNEILWSSMVYFSRNLENDWLENEKIRESFLSLSGDEQKIVLERLFKRLLWDGFRVDSLCWLLSVVPDNIFEGDNNVNMIVISELFKENKKIESEYDAHKIIVALRYLIHKKEREDEVWRRAFSDKTIDNIRFWDDEVQGFKTKGDYHSQFSYYCGLSEEKRRDFVSSIILYSFPYYEIGELDEQVSKLVKYFWYTLRNNNAVFDERNNNIVFATIHDLLTLRYINKKEFSRADENPGQTDENPDKTDESINYVLEELNINWNFSESDFNKKVGEILDLIQSMEEEEQKGLFKKLWAQSIPDNIELFIREYLSNKVKIIEEKLDLNEIEIKSEDDFRKLEKVKGNWRKKFRAVAKKINSLSAKLRNAFIRLALWNALTWNTVNMQIIGNKLGRDLNTKRFKDNISNALSSNDTVTQTNMVIIVEMFYKNIK